ncbi:MAG: MFS transporter [bacterium]|nr:MFS transporter [Candidatus Colisoma equi]
MILFGLGLYFFGVLVPLSGIGPVLDYSVTLFKRAGLDGLGANGVDVLIKGVNLAMTFPALFLADRIGRRTLMIAGSLVMTIALVVTSFSFWSGGMVGALLVDYAAVTAIITGFLPFTTAFGLAGGFVLLAFFSAMLFFVSVFGLKETKGKEL